MSTTINSTPERKSLMEDKPSLTAETRQRLFAAGAARTNDYELRVEGPKHRNYASAFLLAFTLGIIVGIGIMAFVR